jgi:hypothetical protein
LPEQFTLAGVVHFLHFCALIDQERTYAANLIEQTGRTASQNKTAANLGSA